VTDAPSFVFAGYFAKRVTPRPEWLAAPHIREIWSVSDCVAKGPEDWIDHWQHNTSTLFDTPELAASVIPPEQRPAFAIVAYRFWGRIFDEGEELELDDDLPSLPAPDPSFERLGFDAVGRDDNNFMCSPLSCNHAATTFQANEHCLFATLDEAIAGARAFSSGEWEPGPYYIVEVLRRR
jgi:hypothetical protein